MTLSPVFTQKEKEFFKYLIWFQEKKGPVTASYAWLAKKFGMTIEGVRQRIRKAKSLDFCERIRIGQRKWATFFTDKAIEYFSKKMAQARPKHHPEHHPEPIRNPSHTIYIGKVKINNVPAKPGVASSDAIRHCSIIESMPIKPEDKRLFYMYYNRDRKSFIQAVYDCSEYRPAIRNYAGLFTARYQKHCKKHIHQV